MGDIFRSCANLAGLLVALAAAVPALAQGNVGRYENKRANVARATAGQSLTAPSGAEHAAIVTAYLRGRGASNATVGSLRQTSANRSRSGVTHVRMEQQIDGVAVFGRYAKAAINARGELVHLIENLAPIPSAPLRKPTVQAHRALQAAMAHLHPGTMIGIRLLGNDANTTVFSGGAFFHSDPNVTRVAIPTSNGEMELGFQVETWSKATNLLHHTLVGGDGRVLFVEKRTATDSYNIFPVDPGKGPQAVVSGPGAGNVESPIGWLGSGSQSTIAIGGNNVDAYLDTNTNNRADRGGTAVTTGDFLTASDLTVSPSTTGNQAVAVQNLFYLNNVIHDILYRHGFNEAAGNFQADNFGNAGKPRDAVQAEAQDGGGTDNANFATPPDGRKPRMQMYLWTGPGATHRLTVNGADYAAMGAEFGPALTPAGITGLLATTTPADGCTAISTSLSGRIALIDRGACDFSLKALNAQSAGAIAVVIANNQGGTQIFTMAAGTSANRVRIPAIMVSQNDAATLKPLTPVTATASKLAVQPLQKDAALDSDILYHEYCHGLTWRMIGGMSGPLAGAIGEGMADGCAMLINGDDAIGEYSSSNPTGIRRHRYTGYPLTYGAMNSGEVHDDGEAYAAIVWRMMDLFGSSGRARLFSHIVDGMNYTPSRPAYEDMRDGILAAVAGSATPADCSLVWQAFAQFGVGVGASGVENADGTVAIAESFVPGSCP